MTQITTDFKIRTEDIKKEDIQKLFVCTAEDRRTIDMVKAASPVILEGSRGTGKSFLLRVSEIELDQQFNNDRVLPVYVTFVKSSLIHTSDPKQFQHWMLAKICSRVLRALRTAGIVPPQKAAMSLLSGGAAPEPGDMSDIEQLVLAYENSYKNPGQAIDPKAVPDIQEFKDAVEDICESNNINRICLIFDEAIHIFLPEQQRQFFTVFRDLRSPYIGCNAAVYPGVTSYGSVFELVHDATLRRVERDLLSADYVLNMREIVLKQSETNSALIAAINRNGANFSVLAYSVSGNPRLLLKTIARCPELKTTDVNDLIKAFYRSTIWAEHLEPCGFLQRACCID